jgi:Mg-chelatase subunit ChlI
MNPEEGELRPQLLDRFGLVVEIAGIHEVNGRVEVVSRRMSYDLDPDAFVTEWHDSESDLAGRIVNARALLPIVSISRRDMAAVATLSLELGVDGHRADLAILETARTHAAWSGRTQLAAEDIRVAAELALPHRMRRQPFTEVKLDEARVGEILDRVQSAEGDESAVTNADGVKKKTP